jgi:hypothetical protein
MMQQPNKAKTNGKTKAPARRVEPHKRATAARPAPHDPLDDFIAAGARALDLKIDKAWLPAVRSNLAVTLRLARQVTSFSLPDDAEPAPVFKA